MRSILVLLIVQMAASGTAVAQASADEAQIKAAFVYNFLQYVDWPPAALAASRDTLMVGIVGTGPTAEAAARFLAGRPVHNRVVGIRRLKDDTALQGLHVVLIATGDAARSRRILDAVARTAVLSIGETSGFAATGGIIGLLIEARKVRFEINPVAAAAANLKISSKLLALARIVQPRRGPP